VLDHWRAAEVLRAERTRRPSRARPRRDPPHAVVNPSLAAGPQRGHVRLHPARRRRIERRQVLRQNLCDRGHVQLGQKQPVEGRRLPDRILLPRRLQLPLRRLNGLIEIRTRRQHAKLIDRQRPARFHRDCRRHRTQLAVMAFDPLDRLFLLPAQRHSVRA